MRKAKKSNAMKIVEKIAGGPLTLGRAIASIRKSEELTQDECAKKLGVSKSHLCDVEKGRKTLRSEGQGVSTGTHSSRARRTSRIPPPN